MSAPDQAQVPDAVRALAEADFGTVAQRFADAGSADRMPPKGPPTVKGANGGT